MVILPECRVSAALRVMKQVHKILRVDGGKFILCNPQKGQRFVDFWERYERATDHWGDVTCEICRKRGAKLRRMSHEQSQS